MKKMFAALLISASLVACGKKESTTPVNKDKAMEQSDDATGGAKYGGRRGHSEPAPKDPSNPDAK